ncbi:winged helix-turn-helix domain-containing protein [Arthrobacter sp. MMS18-M83]|uniref:winged helix-turn-helix domain-containing protein n=1 Tax=Arthrobacter sp. MMS18-M83 TaxID=2996261 RepID=UPI00227BD317|nr:winged helix-turn-helix domain-containing protein [Arthrobacter sp. MMS18-M83]WAH99759.1 winged helix-turn-helix domain-containing protein [Arthrobacter sp. MMS18-M83]
MSVFQVGTLRAEIIRDMALHPDGSTTQEIAERVGVIAQQVYRHVRNLKNEGIVITLGQGIGYRRGPVYGLDRAALEAKAAAFMRHLLGE